MQIDNPLANHAVIVGHYGVTFITVYCAALLITAKLKSYLIVTIFFLSAAIIKNLNFSKPIGEEISIALIQGSIPQDLKFDEDLARKHRDIYLKMIIEVQKFQKDVSLIVLPETALTRPWEYLSRNFRTRLLDALKKNKVIFLTGIPVRDNAGWKNSVIAIDSALTGEDKFIIGRYDKHHLVPFGEFIPLGFKWFVNLMNIPLGEFKRGPLPQDPINVKDQLIGINICFEDLFGDEIIKSFSKNNPKNNPSILLNVSNLAWFGDSNALSYQLKASRMRSIETERPTIRSTNTGYTVFIDKKGNVIKGIKPNHRGYIVGKVQGTQGLTIFAICGNYLILLVCFLIFSFRLPSIYIK